MSLTILPSDITTMRSQAASSTDVSDEMSSIARPARASSPDQSDDLALGANVDARRRLVQNEDGGHRSQPLADHDLLLVAARKRIHRSVSADAVLIRSCAICSRVTSAAATSDTQV